ncbi:hypothetical protein [Runella sp.]|uniref:hypothetical protein n=1 Tax=Runella sp. TaxID=1960881 RepID=UPI003D14A7F8
MSMQEFPDDELDELFRKSAEEFEPEYEPQAWAKMRKKLDNNGGIQKRPLLLPILLLLLVLSVFSVGGYVLWPQLKTLASKDSTGTSSVSHQSLASNQPNAGSEKETKLSPENTSNSPEQNDLKQQTELKQAEVEGTKGVFPANASENKEDVSDKTVAAASTLASTKDKKDDLINPKKQAADTKKAGSPESPSRISTTTYKAERSKVKSGQKMREVNPTLSTVPAVAFSTKHSSSKTGSTADQQPVNAANRKIKNEFSGSLGKKSNLITADQNKLLSPDRSSASTPASEKSTSINSSVPAGNNGLETAVMTPQISTPNELSIHQWKLLKVAHAPIEVSYATPPAPLAIVKKPETGVASVFKPGLSLRVLAAPDLSFIGFDQMKRPGITLGAMLEYRFNNRFSVQAGAIRAMKLYDALGSQYIWPEAWNSQKARPSNIEAACKVLDIPFNLRYDITQAADKRWFVSLGISSYKMINEKYIYIYPPHSYNIKWPDWEGSTGSYWFGVLNVSMGFERQISKRFTLQGEPYLKIPLSQVGLGKIKLNTAGIFISARYRLGRF